jgi:hypothetical protein
VIRAGLVLFAVLTARRQRLGESAEPVDLPDDLSTAAGLPANGNGSRVSQQTSTTEVKA